MIYYILGIVANTFVMLRAFPQIFKILYYKSAMDVSYLSNIFIIFYASFWMIYGIITNEKIILLMAIILILTSFIIIILKFVYNKNNSKLQKIMQYLELLNNN
ncbi:hypothetical protein [Spiroplasma endosymbiont of Stenodema calcarata]|uniref:hypothetical protein n=1 Tax=Spiroplasma endosymbiont of Stenodema calcarata TaxID=3139328 RepID=UPI003CCB0842